MGILTHLIEAVRIIDEKGRQNPERNSRMLWEKDWEALRLEIISAIFEMKEEEI